MRDIYVVVRSCRCPIVVIIVIVYIFICAYRPYRLAALNDIVLGGKKSITEYNYGPFLFIYL